MTQQQTFAETKQILYLQWYIRLVSNHLIQVVINNFKLIILDYLAAMKSGILDWHRFLRLVHKQSLYLEDNLMSSRYLPSKIHSGIMLYTCTQRDMLCPCEMQCLVQCCSWGHCCHNSKHLLIIVSTFVLRLKAVESLLETSQCT